MSGTERDEAKQRAWQVASNMALDFFGGYYSKGDRIALASAIFEDAYAAGRAAGIVEAWRAVDRGRHLSQSPLMLEAIAAIRALAEGKAPPEGPL